MTRKDVEEMVENAITYSDYSDVVTILFTNYSQREINEILKSFIRQNGDGDYDLIIASITECLGRKRDIDAIINGEI